MPSTNTIVIGAGQAGLAASHCLTDQGVEHVVLERGRLAERWRSERWDALRLLTPNWMSRLPGWSYAGPDRNGYMTAPELISYLAAYAEASNSPIHEGHDVVRLDLAEYGFVITTSLARWRCTNVIIATGWCDRPAVPDIASRLDRTIVQTTPSAYRNPGSLPDGGVLVVGASASGAQLAAELATAGRHVVLSVGAHTRVPRHYRGMDIFWWLHRIGSLDRTIDEVADPIAAPHEPSLQLVGRPDQRNLDLTTLREDGVELAGRCVGIDGARVDFAADLATSVGSADARMHRVLAEIDEHIEATGLATEVLDPEPQRQLQIADPPGRIDLRRRRIASVIWATGHRRTYPWLHAPALDRHGELVQSRGVTPVDGLYVLGQRFQHRRSSNFIGGVGRDAAEVVDHLVARAGASSSATRSARCR